MSSKKRQPALARRTSDLSNSRNRCLDTLRGFAIVLMVIDHAADLWWNVAIAPDTIRIVTRLSMPLFCGLMGYFLIVREHIAWNRLLQLGIATLVVNMAFFTVYRRLDILASLLVCYGIFIVFRKGLLVGLIAPFFFYWDESGRVFDFPISVVWCCVAQGAVVRLGGWRWGIATALLVTAGAWFVPPPTQYVLLFVLPATGLIAWGAGQAERGVKWLEFLGRFPLTSYITQYYVLLVIAAG